MDSLLSTTNSLHDWIGISGLILAATSGLVWRMHVLWQTEVKPDVDSMILMAKVEIAKQIKEHDKKADEMRDSLKDLTHTADKGMIRIENIEKGLTSVNTLCNDIDKKVKK